MESGLAHLNVSIIDVNTHKRDALKQCHNYSVECQNYKMLLKFELKRHLICLKLKRHLISY